MASLVTIPGTIATVREGHATTLFAAFADLKKVTGVQPMVLAKSQTEDGISGGSRTLAEAIKAGTGKSSDHYEDNALGRSAVDIDNQLYFRNVIGTAFEAILGKYGWHNMTIDGAPFPSEPWHFATHDPESPYPPTEDDDMMIFWNCTVTSKDGQFVAGKRYAQASPVSPVLLYGDSSTLAAISEQFPGFSQAETRINGNDLSRLAGYYNLSSGSGVTAEQARSIAANEDSKLIAKTTTILSK